MVVVFIWHGSWVWHGSSGSVGMAMAWRFLISRSANGMAIEVEVFGFLDQHGMARLLHFSRGWFGGSCDGGVVAWA